MADVALAQRSILEACFFGYAQPYLDTLSLMHYLHGQVARGEIPEQLMLLEHEPVITATRQHLLRSIKTSEKDMSSSGIAFAIADRGGDATFHGPGQLVGYPIMKIQGPQDIGHYIRSLESALLLSMLSIGVRDAVLLPGFTGVWVKYRKTSKNFELRKLVAIGVGVKDGVSKHGFAINIDIDWHRYALHLIPCGLKDRGVITLKELFDQDGLLMPSHLDIVQAVSKSISDTFCLTLKWRSPI